MRGTPLLAKPFLDDDEDVRRVQRFAGAGDDHGHEAGSAGHGDGPVTIAVTEDDA
jgi:hypothetical protein